MSPRPKMCVVATGTNSIYQGTAGVNVVKAICQTLIANQIYPVLWTLPPRNDTSWVDANMVAWNTAIREYHKETGIPLLDAFEALRVPGSMRARVECMNPDGLHFNNFGYTELGRYAIDSKAFKAAPTDGKLPLATAVGGGNLVPNPLFAGSFSTMPSNVGRLPVGFRPAKRKVFCAFVDSSTPLRFGSATVFVQTTGAIQVILVPGEMSLPLTDFHLLLDDIPPIDLT